jgi:hypothetical protein
VPERHEELPSAFFPPDPSADPDASATPEDDIDSVTESGQRFGDRVVDDFVDPVVQSRGRPRLLLVDVHGELRSWYRRASAATVGGTWVRIGGHNLFEPLCEGVPVSFGPYVANVRDVAGAALGEGAAFQCEDPAALVSWVLAQADPANRQKTERSALRAARNLAGAGERTRAFLSEVEASEEWGGIIRPSAQESRAKTGPPSS